MSNAAPVSISTAVIDADDTRRARLLGLVAENPEFHLIGEARTTRAAILSLSRLQPELLIAVSDAQEPNQSSDPMMLLQAMTHSTVVLVGDHGPARIAELAITVFSLALPEVDSALPGLLQHISQQRIESSNRIAARILARARASRTIAYATMPSPRQMEVLQHLLEGQSHRAIANGLGISQATVDRHVADLFVKLNVASREQAIARASELGWLCPSG
jgi:DNA-binding NarL/FixJ family response regulator